jgi:DNA-binding transcriptional LysR family regulator
MAPKKKVVNRLSGYKQNAAPAIPNWDDIRVFMTVARSGSYRSAAQALTMTQPSVSHRIARFEATIGVKLFDRTSRGVELTADGQRVLNHAGAAELSLTKALSVVREATENAEGECKVGIGDGLGGEWVPRFMPAFFGRNANVKLSLFTTNDRAVSKKPMFDLQVQYHEPLDEDLTVQKLATLHFTLFATRSYVEAYGSPASLEDLVHHRILDLSLALTDRGTLASWAGVSNRTALFTNSSVALAESVWAGAGIGMLPTYAAAIEPSLVAVMPDLHRQAHVYVCYEREMGRRPAVRATLNFLKDVMFDHQAMPWFAESFHLPHAGWHDQLKAYLAKLSDPQIPEDGTTRKGKSAGLSTLQRD